MVHTRGGFLMPRIPILPGDVSAANVANDPFGSLPPAQTDGIRALEARDEGITRGLTVAEAWRDGVTALQQAEGAEDGAPAGFARDFFANVDRGRSVALRSAPAGQRDALDSDLRGLRADLGDRAVTAEAAGLGLRRRLGLMQTLDTYANGVAEDPGLFDSADGQINNLVEGLGLPENRASALRTEMRTRLANAAVDGLMADPAEAEAALRLGLYDDVLPKEIKQQRLAEAETQMQRASLLDGERRRQALSRRAAEGAAGDTEIAAAQADGSLSDTDAERLRVQTAQAQQSAETRRARIDRVAGGDPLDPANEEDRQAADAYWEDVSEAYAFDDPAQQRQAELDMVRRIGVLPTGLTRKYRGMLLSRDPEIVVDGARAITEIDHLDLPIAGFVPPSRNGLLPLPGSEDPPVFKKLPARPSNDLIEAVPLGDLLSRPDAIPDEDRRRAVLITEFVDLGLPADRAVELADEKLSEEEPAANTTPADGSVVDNDQTDAPFVSGEDEREDDPAPAPANDDAIVDNDRTDTPIVGDEATDDDPEQTPLTDEEVDEILRRDQIAPIPRDGEPIEQEGEEEEDGQTGLNTFVWLQKNELMAVQQGTSPDTERHERLGRYGEFAAGGGFVDEDGQFVRADGRKHVVLIDPKNGELTIYRRSEPTNEGGALSIGRLLGASSFVDSLGGAVSTGVRALQMGTKGKTGASSTLASGVGPTGGRASKSKAAALRDLPKGPGFQADRKFLTADEFSALPSEGRIDPQRIRTSQSSLKEEFKPKRDASGKIRKRTVSGLTDELRDGVKKPEDIKAIILIEFKRQVYTVDHRRLIAFRRAGIDIPYRKVEFDKLSDEHQKRIRQAPNLNDNGAAIKNRTLKVKE